MLAKVARFELRYQLTSPIFWITAIVFFLLTLTLIVSDTIRVGWGGYVTRNSPFTTALMCMVMMIFAIFIATSFAANVVLRDDETGFGPIIRTTRLSKFSYLFGRFTGGFLVSCLAFASVPLALRPRRVLAGRRSGDGRAVPPRHLPLRVLRDVRADAVRAGGVVLCAGDDYALDAHDVCRGAHRADDVLPERRVSARAPSSGDMMSLLDPFGARLPSGTPPSIGRPNERNTLLPPFLGPMLTNRALWMAVSLALLALTWRSFRQDKPSETEGVEGQGSRGCRGGAARRSGGGPVAATGSGFAVARLGTAGRPGALRRAERAAQPGVLRAGGHRLRQRDHRPVVCGRRLGQRSRGRSRAS